jgi:hypothetical protein
MFIQIPVRINALTQSHFSKSFEKLTAEMAEQTVQELLGYTKGIPYSIY